MMMTQIEKLSNELPFLEKTTKLKQSLDKHRSLSDELEKKVFQKLRLDWNYNSNAIEGNVFTYGETIALLMEGITAKGKPLKDALDIKGHNEAINFMLDMIHDNRELNEFDIRSLHKLVLGESYYKSAKTADGKPTRKLISVGQYKTEPNHVQTATGEIHYYATPEETPAKIQELVSWYNEVITTKQFHPIVLASLFHHKFVAIHPFDDGNGRMTRILTNFILLKFGYPVSVIKQERKQEYYACLSQADRGEIIPIIEYITESVQHSLEIYIKAINGEDINEPDDIDKEIALFRKEVGKKAELKKAKENVDVLKISFDVFNYTRNKLSNFFDFFQSHFERLNLNFDEKEIYISDMSIFDYKEFKKKVSSDNSPYKNIEYHLSLEMLKRDEDFFYSFDVNLYFDLFHYDIQVENTKIRKYYNENTLDIDTINVINKHVKVLMSELKKNKTSL